MREGDRLLLISTEGGREYCFAFGFYGYAESIIEPGAERYIALGIADSREDEFGNILYRLELLFPELPNTRRITLSLGADFVMSVKMTEIPDERIAAIRSVSLSGR